MRKIGKKIVSAALATGMLASTFPTSLVFAADAYKATLVMEVTSAKQFPVPGDEVRFSVYIKDAGWAQMANGTGLAAYSFKLNYDGTVLQYKESVMADAVKSTFNTADSNHIAERSEVRWLVVDDDDLENELSLTNEKTKLGDIVFTVKDNLPENLDGTLEFTYPTSVDMVFGDMSDPSNQPEGIDQAVVAPELVNQVQFDTTDPIVKVENGDATTFYYSPVTITVTDTSGVKSVTWNGTELASPYTVSKSGTVVVTDNTGNSTTKEIVIDDAAYLAAKAAIEALPQTIGFKDEALVTAARKAVDAVTDATAKSKLDLSRLQKAEAEMTALNEEKAQLLQALQTKPTVSLRAEDVEAIEALRQRVTAMEQRGASFTAQQLKNLTDAESELTALQQRSEKAHADIAALPTAEETVMSDSEKVSALKTEMAALEQLGDSFTEAEKAKIAEVEKGLQAIATLKTEVEAAIQAVLGEAITPALATKVNEVNQQIALLNSKGVESTSLKDYDKFAKVAEQVQEMLEKIDAVTEQINALPQADKLTFGDEKSIQDAAAALDNLRKEGLDVTAETAQKLADVQNALAQLKAQRADLVKEIADAKLNISLNEQDVQAIEALRAKVDALNEKGAAFTAQELKNLTDAETALNALKERSKKAHDQIAALPTAEDTVLSDAEKIEALKTEMAALEQLGDVFTAEEKAKITEVENGLQAIADLKDETEKEIETVLGKEVSPELANEVNAIQEKIDVLVQKGVEINTIKNYEEFVKVAETVAEMLEKIQKVSQMINALPQGEALKFQDETAIEAAVEALEALRAEKLDITAEVAQKLADAQKNLEDLKAERAAVVKEIANATFNVTLKAEDVKQITDLAARVTALTNRGANFTEEEVGKFNTANKAMNELLARSKKAHSTIASLPTAEATQWSLKDTIAQLEKEMKELAALADTFSEEEQAKVAAVKTALSQIEKDAAALKNTMEQLPTQADANSAKKLEEVNAAIASLQKRGYKVNAESMGAAAWNRYEAFKKAVEAFQGTVPTVPTTPTTPSPSPSTQSPIAQTGDRSSLGLLASLAGLSAAAIAILSKKRKSDKE